MDQDTKSASLKTLKSFKSKSVSMSVRKAFQKLGLSENAIVEDINDSFKKKLEEIQSKYADKPDKMVAEGDALYSAYRTAYLHRDPNGEDKMLPLTMTGSDAMLNLFGVTDLPHQSLKVQMQSQAQYKDGKLVNENSSKSENFINHDGKREIKVWDNNKLVKHTIDGKDVLK